ncbi:MAG: hypothetical protein ACJ75J_03840, partial [Cytophagaceae bacterium]
HQIDFEKIVGTELKISRFTKNDYASRYLPESGKIIRRITISKEPDWYMVKLDKPKNVTGYMTDTIVIRTKEKEELLEPGFRMLIAFFIIPEKTDLENKNLERTKLKFCGWAIVE